MKKIGLLFLLFLGITSCKEEPKKELKKESTITLVDYVSLGNKYAQSTQKVLGKNLIGTIKKEGTLAALAFCNVKAFPLTDSMSAMHKVKIRRISDKYRNTTNAVNAEELGYLEEFKKKHLNYETLSPIIKESKKTVDYYSPIKVLPACLQCHGTPEKEIKTRVFKSIEALYPEDKAIGYQVNDIRGMWHITFQKK